MKFKVIGVMLALFVLLACGFTVSGEQKNDVAAASLPAVAEKSADPVLTARLQNMLDHNRVYNDDYDSTVTMIDNSVTALIDKADEDGFIDSNIVLGFVYNMYGIDLSEYTPNPDFPQKDGCIFVVPRGLDTYEQSITNIELDGEYIYTDSVVTVSTHEGFVYEYNCRSLFKENPASGFGYNLISSTIY